MIEIPPKVNIEICTKCNPSWTHRPDSKYWFTRKLVNTTKSWCPRKGQELNIKTDYPPDNCKYLLEHIVSTEE